MRFSVITCTFNAAKTLPATVGSLASQTCRDFEHIIIDACSTDGTASVVPEGVARILCEPDRGLYDAMNKGIFLAKGDYLVFLNAGDTLHSADTLERVSEMIDGAGTVPDIVYGQTAIVSSDGTFLSMRSKSAPDNLNWKSFRKGMLVCHQAFWVRREAALAVPYDLQYRFSADVDWCIRIMKRSQRYLYTGAILADYLAGGMTAKNRKASLLERFRIMVRHYGLPCTLWNHFLFLVRAVENNDVSFGGV